MIATAACKSIYEQKNPMSRSLGDIDPSGRPDDQLDSIDESFAPFLV